MFFLGKKRQVDLQVIPRQGFSGRLVSGVGLVGCVLFENCTVDASIFVVSNVRAYGGCLGTRSR